MCICECKNLRNRERLDSLDPVYARAISPARSARSETDARCTPVVACVFCVQGRGGLGRAAIPCVCVSLAIKLSGDAAVDDVDGDCVCNALEKQN